MKNSIFLLVLLFLASSINVNSQWVQANNGIGNTYMYALTSSENNIYAGNGLGVYKSVDNGTSWTQINSNFIVSLASHGNSVYAGALNGAFLSTDNGVNWISTNLNFNVFALTTIGSISYAGTWNHGIYASTNGSTWSQNSLNGVSFYSLAANGTNVYAGSVQQGIYLSTNSGATWTQTSLNNLTVNTIVINGNNIFAGVWDQGVYLSVDGINWVQTSLSNQTINALVTFGNTIIAGTKGNGIFVSNDNGASWINRSEGLGNDTVNCLGIANNYVFAGVHAYSVYRRPLSEIVGLQPISTEVPQLFSLLQNYPNPFNPSTKIKFQIPKSDFVNIAVFDVLGRKINTLLNENLSPGTYEVDWNASDYPSGVYYYKLTAGNYTETKKMILMK